MRIKLKDSGYFGLVCSFGDVPITMATVRCLYEQVLATGKLKKRWMAVINFTFQLLIGLFCCLCGADPTPNFRDLLAVAYLSHRADLSVRLDICRKVSD